MLSSKQRAYLRSLANKIDTILIIGKGGIDKDVIKQADDALKKRELIKAKVLVETAPITPEDAANEMKKLTGSEVVQVIGSKFILYRKNLNKTIIEIPKNNVL